jgi:hypothetical protein
VNAKLTPLLKFLALVVVLNVLRYLLGFPFEKWLIFERLLGAMQRSSSCFNTQFTTFDWATSYFYNFMMWLTITWVFVMMHPVLRGSILVKSLKVYALMFLFFASVSAIYMNHYRHPKDFYAYNILDGLIVYTLVGVVNGLIYPLLFKSPRTP